VKKSAIFLLIFITLLSGVSCSKRVIRVKPVNVYENLSDNEDVILENEYLSLRFMPETTAIILTDKATGAQWHSNPKGSAVDRYADAITTYLMDSQFSLEYSDATGVGMTLYSNESSVQLNAYEYEIVDGVLEVRYTVGDVARTYRIPAAATEEKMRAFIEKMAEEDQSMVEISYRLYDINNLRSNDNEDALLAAYPDLNRTNVFVLRESTQDYMKEILEELFINAGYTYEDFLEDTLRYPSSSGMNKPAFNLTLRYMLDGKSLVLNVPYDQIAYRPNFPFRQLTLLPFMGSGGLDDEGFMFVPDGSGAIINFNNGKQNQVPFNVNIYGWDEALPRDAVVSDTRAPFPVFGIQKNNAALLCIIEEGSSYANISLMYQEGTVHGTECTRILTLFTVQNWILPAVMNAMYTFMKTDFPMVKILPCVIQSVMIRAMSVWQRSTVPGCWVNTPILGRIRSETRFPLPLKLSALLTKQDTGLASPSICR